MTASATRAGRATRREWSGLAVIALPCAVYAMDLTVLNLALPAIATELQPSAAQQLWIIDVYGFLVAGFLITMGTLGDRIGRRRLLLAGAAFFLLASIAAAFASSAEMLIAMRALLGLAGATVAPSTLSLIRNMFHDERERQFAIGVWISSFSAGGALGPLIGGVLLQHFHWGAVFLAAVPVMAMLLALGPRLLPEYRDPQAGRVDLASVALSLAAVLTTIYATKRMAEHGPAWADAGLLLLGLGIAAAFVHRQTHLAYPLLDLKLFRLAGFRAALTAYGLSCFAMFGIYIFVTQFLQLVLGLSPLAAGAATVPWSLGFVVGSLAAPAWARRWGGARVLVGGLAAAAAGLAVLVAAGGPFGLAAIVGGTLLMSLGMAPVFTIGTEIIVTSAPPERAGAASAIAETASEFFGALGIALFGSLGTVLYRAGLAPALPAALPADDAERAMATLGGAVAAAGTLPPAEAQALLHGARAAFTDGLQCTAIVGALLIAVACVVAARILRGGRTAAAVG